MVNKALSKRTKQKQLWADPDFIAWLKQLRAKKQLGGVETANLGELTRQLVNAPAIKDIESQILNGKDVTSIKIKLDAKRIFG